MLTLVPGGPDTETGAAPGQHIESRDGLREQAGIAVGDPGHEQPQLHVLGYAGDETEGVYPSSIGSSAGPRAGGPKKWSMNEMPLAPTDSAA